MNDITKLIGQRLRTYRKDKGLSQEELAHRAALHTTYIGQLERGEKNATIESLYKVASALDITLEDLFKYLPSDKLSEQSMIIMRIVEKLHGKSIDDQKYIADMIESLLSWKDNSK
ncbi:helix-turn-helix domain-containing protein [Cytobacillus spongiae]|uniref:helix-turn-helix domain-containing protein n=1 Tax=Cytobacillus spongiae TaxID=2901381 RepID=UPI001F3A86B7|nr:helix-turn-helix transcriptional regulator [Cytobacillus spongiae]UII57065.1 helix-turn-helix domain-containing protein [Cytobacillus spongiae]